MARFPFPARMSAEMINPLQSFRVDLGHWGTRELQVLELGVGGREVKYGPGIRPRLEIREEHTEIALAEHRRYVLLAMRLSAWSGEQTRFVTAGDDHKIVIWDVHGRVVRSFSEHIARVGALWELTNKRLASWSEDRLLLVWSLETGDLIGRIRTMCPPHRVCIDASGDFFCLAEYWRARIVDVEGEVHATLKWHFPSIKQIRRLARSDRWLTQSPGDGTKLWSKGGSVQARIQHSFSLEDGYFEFRPPSEQLLIIDDAHCLELFDREGLKIGGRDKDGGLAADLKAFFRSEVKAREAIEVRTTHQHFERRINPLSAPSPKSQPTSSTRANDALDDRQKVLSTFFERPDPRSIRTWLRDELEAAVQARETVEAALHDDRTHAQLLSSLQGFVIAVGGAAIWFLPKTHGDAQFALVLVAVVAVVTLMWAQLGIFAMSAAERVLTVLPKEMERLATKVKIQRRRVIAGMPTLRSPSVYAGREVLESISDTIAGELSERAFRECGVLPQELLNLDGAPVTLWDWTLLRKFEAAEQVSEISPRHLNCFWWTPTGHFVFAVQTLQFVLLTARKIDIYTVDYDFIARRAHNATILTLYYGEVTDVTKRRRSRPFADFGVSAEVTATEVALVLRSGGCVTLTLLDEGASALREAVKKHMAPIFADQLRNLATEEAARPRPIDFSQEAWTLEKNYLRAEMETLDAPAPPTILATPSLDDMIACIKRQILLHKDPPTGTG